MKEEPNLIHMDPELDGGQMIEVKEGSFCLSRRKGRKTTRNIKYPLCVNSCT